jgi:hypothetical protein
VGFWKISEIECQYCDKAVVPSMEVCPCCKCKVRRVGVLREGLFLECKDALGRMVPRL